MSEEINVSEETQKIVNWLGTDHPVAQAFLMEETVMMTDVLMAVLETFHTEVDYLRSEVERLEGLIPWRNQYEEKADDEGDL
jgi:hypothetical protein